MGDRREQWAALDFDHGAAFLIAQIKSTKPSPHAARITIEFETYAMLDIPGAWQLLAKGQRFPVAYLETAELFRRLALNPNQLVWQPLLSQRDHGGQAQARRIPRHRLREDRDHDPPVTRPDNPLRSRESRASAAGPAA